MTGRILIDCGSDRTDFNAGAHGPWLCDEFHRPIPELGYMQGIDDAEERMKRKERQMECPRCSRWIWLEYVHHVPRKEILTHIRGKHWSLKGDPRPPFPIAELTPDYEGVCSPKFSPKFRKKKQKLPA